MTVNGVADDAVNDAVSDSSSAVAAVVVATPAYCGAGGGLWAAFSFDAINSTPILWVLYGQ